MNIFYLFTETITYNAENTIINGRKFLFFLTHISISQQNICFALAANACIQETDKTLITFTIDRSI